MDEARNFVDSVLANRQATYEQPEEVDYNSPVVTEGRLDQPLTTTATMSETPPSKGSDPMDFIFNSEARRDKSGRLQIYNPPSGDGGGSFEVAGITARYQPKEAKHLKSLIEAGKNEEAEAYAKDFYRKRAKPFTKYASNEGLKLQLADTVHHRGEGGLRSILRRATGLKTKDYSELINTLDNDPKALDKFNRARVDYEMEEVDRGRASRQKFRKGLLNRFKNADAAARQLS